MQEAGAGASSIDGARRTVTTPGERHRIGPSTTALHILATCELRSPPAATCHLQCPPCCRLILAFECSRARSIIDQFIFKALH